MVKLMDMAAVVLIALLVLWIIWAILFTNALWVVPVAVAALAGLIMYVVRRRQSTRRG